MKRVILLSLLSALVLSLSGCITTHSYVDPQYHKAGYESISRPAQPVAVKVDIHFERNGEAYPRAEGQLRTNVEQTLRASGVFTPAPSSATGTITVTANNIADMAKAASKGFLTGLTFGAAGSTVDDDYEFVCVYQGGGVDKSFTYHHAIHTTIGNASAPVAGVAPTTPSDAFAHVVQDVMLNFVKDLQDNGVVPKQ